MTKSSSLELLEMVPNGEVPLTLPRTAELRAQTYSPRRVIAIWILLCLAGWAVIAGLVNLVFTLV